MPRVDSPLSLLCLKLSNPVVGKTIYSYNHIKSFLIKNNPRQREKMSLSISNQMRNGFLFSQILLVNETEFSCILHSSDN